VDTTIIQVRIAEADIAPFRDMPEATHRGYAYVTIETLGPATRPTGARICWTTCARRSRDGCRHGAVTLNG
jgi:hypothetical protein